MVIAAGAVAGSYVSIRTQAAQPLDTVVGGYLRPFHTPRSDRVVAVVTDLGSIYGTAGIAATLAALGRRTAGRDVAVAGALAWVAAQSAKPLLPRLRPYETGAAHRLVSIPAGSSWPSGHAAVAASTAATVAPHLTARGRLFVGAVVLAVGVSRLHVGVHHLSDVVAGVGVGVLSAGCWQTLGRRLEQKVRTR
jgi:undecaprenyl-diphosphatase